MIRYSPAVLAALILAFALLCVFAGAEGQDVSEQSESGNGEGGGDTWMYAVMSIIMLAVISVIGVMFLRILQKDKNSIHR
ncbi:MAG: hypothetical protein J5793_01925 [Clostridia bacterium]|nr:hypothetical protein [Clostridia bacterium]